MSMCFIEPLSERITSLRTRPIEKKVCLCLYRVYVWVLFIEQASIDINMILSAV